jgi:uncharacterized Zn finger protein (UPF0148 family)
MSGTIDNITKIIKQGIKCITCGCLLIEMPNGLMYCPHCQKYKNGGTK